MLYKATRLANITALFCIDKPYYFVESYLSLNCNFSTILTASIFQTR